MKLDSDRDLVIRRISDPKLMEGGAAMLHAEKQNHQNVREGNKVIIPFVKNILRD